MLIDITRVSPLQAELHVQGVNILPVLLGNFVVDGKVLRLNPRENELISCQS